MATCNTEEVLKQLKSYQDQIIQIEEQDKQTNQKRYKEWEARKAAASRLSSRQIEWGGKRYECGSCTYKGCCNESSAPCKKCACQGKGVCSFGSVCSISWAKSECGKNNFYTNGQIEFNEPQPVPIKTALPDMSLIVQCQDCRNVIAPNVSQDSKVAMTNVQQVTNCVQSAIQAQKEKQKQDAAAQELKTLPKTITNINTPPNSTPEPTPTPTQVSDSSKKKIIAVAVVTLIGIVVLIGLLINYLLG
jgi:hypothetical protein